MESTTPKDKMVGGVIAAVAIGCIVLLAALRKDPTPDELRQLHQERTEHEAKQRLQKEDEDFRKLVRELQVQEEMARQRSLRR